AELRGQIPLLLAAKLAAVQGAAEVRLGAVHQVGGAAPLTLRKMRLALLQLRRRLEKTRSLLAECRGERGIADRVDQGVHRFGELCLPDGDRGSKVGSIGAGCRALDLLDAGRRRAHDGDGFELDGNGAADGSVDGGTVAADVDRLARALPSLPRR